MITGSPTQLSASVAAPEDLAGLPDDAFRDGDFAYVSQLAQTYRLNRASAVNPNNADVIGTFSDNGRWILFNTANAPIYQNYTAVRGIDVANVGDGQGIVVAGYAGVGDGGAGTFYYDAGSVDADDDGTILQPAVGGGRWVRSYSGPGDARWFGAVADGVTDDTAAINAALLALGYVELQPGNYAVTTVGINGPGTKNRSIVLRGAGSSIYGGDNGRAILSALAATPVLQIGDDDTLAGSSSPMQVLVEGIEIEGNNLATSGIRITRGGNVTIRRSTARSCAKGFFVDPILAVAPGASATLDTLLFESCYSFQCTVGLSAERIDPVVGSFGVFRITEYQSAQDTTGLRIVGCPEVLIETSILQPTGDGAVVVDSNAVFDSCFIECGGNTLDVSGTSFGSTVVTWRNSVAGTPLVDANSSFVVENGYVNAAGILTQRCSFGRPSDDAYFGPPNQITGIPVAKPGAVWKRGMTWMDAYGITWVCVVSGTSAAARFVPRDGKVIRPISYTEMLNGNVIWWAQADMLVRAITVIAGGAYAVTGTDATQRSAFGTAAPQDIIALTQLPYATLSGASASVVQANLNVDASSRMNAKQELFFVGSPANIAPANSSTIRHYTDHNPAGYNAGSILMLLDVYPLSLI